MLYLATITLAISFVAQFMINVEAHSLSAHQDRHKNKRLYRNKSNKLKNRLAKKRFQKRNKRPECRHYDPCANFVNAMQRRHKSVTPGRFPNNIMRYRKNGCAAGTSGSIQCGMTFSESVTLTGDLFCDGTSANSIFITMQGEDTILDCNGYKIFGSTVGRRGIAVRLTDGASAINCPIGNVAEGISIDGDACSTVMNVAIAFTNDDSIVVANSGTTVLDSIVIESSNQDGIDVTGGGGLVIMSDITVSGVDEDGICLSTGGATVGLYGDIFIEKAGADGFSFDGANFAVTAYCSLTLFYNMDGISFDDTNSGSFTFESGSTTTSCFNTNADIEGIDGTGDGFVRVHGANVQCDNVASAGTFACNEDCVILPRLSSVGFAPACLANDEES